MKLALIAKWAKEPTYNQLQSKLNHELAHVWARLLLDSELSYKNDKKWEVK